MVNYLRVILATVVIFATGALSGYFIARNATIPSAATPVGSEMLQSTNAPAGWSKSREEIRASLQKELDATDEQMAKVDEILSQSRKRSRDVWQNMKGDMEAELERVKEEIRGVLDEEQATKYEEILKRQKSDEEENKDRDKGASEACLFNYLYPVHLCLL